MKLVERTFELRGPEGLGAKPRPELIGPVLSSLHATLLDTVRMGFLHSSRTTGRIPSALHRAAEVVYTGHTGKTDGVTELHFEVPQFGSAAGELFAQGQLWETGPQPEQTAVDLLAVTLGDVRQMAKDSTRFDHALLHRFSRYERVLKRGLDAIGLPDAITPTATAIDMDLSRAATSLYSETPPPRRVRVCGRLDMLTVSRRVLGFYLDSGAAATAVWMGADVVDLAGFLNRRVLIEGIAHFRPSGTLLRIDAEAIDHAGPNDEFFSTLPLPDFRRDYTLEASRGRPSQTPHGAIFGFLPGDESDHEFAAAVEALG